MEGADLLGWAAGAALPHVHADGTARNVCETLDPPRVAMHVLGDAGEARAQTRAEYHTLTKKTWPTPGKSAWERDSFSLRRKFLRDSLAVAVQ